VTELGTRANPKSDRIELDGDRLTRKSTSTSWFTSRAASWRTLHDPEGRPSVGDMLATLGVRAFPIGRLDFATSGVLPRDERRRFRERAAHPRGGVPKRYIVKLAGKMGEDDIERWRRGVELEDGRTLPADVDLVRYEGDKTWIELTIREGRNQQIRRMGEATRFPVMRLARTSFAASRRRRFRRGDGATSRDKSSCSSRRRTACRRRSPTIFPKAAAKAHRAPGANAQGGRFEQKTTGARYGMGAPARRDPETTEDYGGRAHRGESRTENRDNERRGRATCRCAHRQEHLRQVGRRFVLGLRRGADRTRERIVERARRGPIGSKKATARSAPADSSICRGQGRRSCPR